jgi:hypothetical protein
LQASATREAPVRTEPHPTRSFALPAPAFPTDDDSEITPQVDLSFHLRSPVEGLSIPAMQKNPSQLGNSRLCGTSKPAFCPAEIAFRDAKPRTHCDKSLKHFLSKRPIAIYLRCPSHQLHIVALPRTSWQVTGPPTTSDGLIS